MCLWFQVKYREEYEKNKGRSQMEFGDTQTYKVSKEAQKMQSEVKHSLSAEYLGPLMQTSEIWASRRL